jgi:hypothetical protein
MPDSGLYTHDGTELLNRDGVLRELEQRAA